jgi:hypothetical protein
MTDLTLENLRSELAPIRAQLDGLPVINRALTVLQQDVRSLRAAFHRRQRLKVVTPAKAGVQSRHSFSKIDRSTSRKDLASPR